MESRYVRRVCGYLRPFMIIALIGSHSPKSGLLQFQNVDKRKYTSTAKV